MNFGLNSSCSFGKVPVRTFALELYISMENKTLKEKLIAKFPFFRNSLILRLFKLDVSTYLFIFEIFYLDCDYF